MDLALSPYDLTLLDPAALAACLLGERVVTLLPVPAAGLGREHVAAAFATSPRYARLLDSWRWSVPLWREGVLSSLLEDEHAGSDTEQAAGRVAQEAAWAGLQALMHAGLEPGTGEGLDLTAADLLKGGADPGISLPLCAGLDAFALRRGAVVVRRGAGVVAGPGRTRCDSAAQAAERQLGESVASVALPILLDADAGRILAARAVTGAQRRALGAAILRVLNADLCQRPAEVAALRTAAKAFADAIEDFAATDTARCKTGWVRLVLRRLPADATLLSAVAAARVMPGPTSAPASPAPPRGRSERGLSVVVVEPMTIAPAPANGRAAPTGVLRGL
ncbi:MAG: hypothetical protein ACKVS8_06470 [Phycisphaerales bacterium]